MLRETRITRFQSFLRQHPYSSTRWVLVGRSRHYSRSFLLIWRKCWLCYYTRLVEKNSSNITLIHILERFWVNMGTDIFTYEEKKFVVYFFLISFVVKERYWINTAIIFSSKIFIYFSFKFSLIENGTWNN